ncbi:MULTISPECIES: hypothetical protein [Methylomonas]|uniref:Uncharacterized protein n=2 Tax=Methylomonas TaxID=416 RepID=A0A126T1T5_9GAMM|nr:MULTISPECIES: hypothetical protein [Methylomonas]AMK76037.1 hypothetical protein JT25_005945 [Methylomonas denitrificans]OAH99830.1 hypothetical protein A1342_16830 [Methylomonas methanica]TCV83944.1 hypothetical protein EDE11_10874 [Methylomonas methanica]
METSKPETPDPGVFLVKGDTVSIPSFSVSIDEEGKMNADPVILKTGIEMTPYWLNIAYKHLISTEVTHKKLMLVKAEENNRLIGECLKKEYSSGMQAIMASGIAIDAYYASVKEHVKIPKDQVDAWQKKAPPGISRLQKYFELGSICLRPTSKA